MDSRVSGHPVSHIRVRDLVFLALGILALIALFLYAPGDGIRAAAPRNDVPEPVPSIEPKISAASPVTCTGWAKTFFLTYINSGGADLTNATIVITVPMWTEVITSESTAGLIPGPNPGTVMWNLGTVTSTAILRELTLLIDPLLDPGTPLLLEAVFDADNAEAVLLSIEFAPELCLEACKDYDVVDVDGNGLATPGDIIEYFVDIHNTSQWPVAGAIYSDIPDPNTTLIEGSVQTTQGTVTTGNGPGDTTIEVAVGDIAPYAIETVRYRVRINVNIPPGVVLILNQGMLRADDVPGFPTDNCRTPLKNDPTKINLVLGIRDWHDPHCAGWNQAYTISFRNSSEEILTNVVVTAYLPMETTLVPELCSPGIVVDGPQTVHWNLGTVAVGQLMTRRLEIRPWASWPAGATMVTCVTADGDRFDALLDGPVTACEDTTIAKCVVATVTPRPTSTPSPTATPTATATPTVTPTLPGGDGTLFYLPLAFKLGIHP